MVPIRGERQGGRCLPLVAMQGGAAAGGRADLRLRGQVALGHSGAPARSVRMPGRHIQELAPRRPPAVSAYRVLGRRDVVPVWMCAAMPLAAPMVVSSTRSGILPNPQDHPCFPKAGRAAGYALRHLVRALRTCLAADVRTLAAQEVGGSQERLRESILFDGGRAGLGPGHRGDDEHLGYSGYLRRAGTRGQPLPVIWATCPGSPDQRLDLVFNLCKGVNGLRPVRRPGGGGPWSTRVPFACPYWPVTICREHITNTLLAASGVQCRPSCWREGSPRRPALLSG